MRKTLIICPEVPHRPRSAWGLRHVQLISTLSGDSLCTLVSFASSSQLENPDLESKLYSVLSLAHMVLVPEPRRTRVAAGLLGAILRKPLAVPLYSSVAMKRRLQDLTTSDHYDVCLILGDICMAQYSRCVHVERKIWDLCDDLPLVFSRRAAQAGSLWWRCYYRHQANIVERYVRRVSWDFDHILVIADKDGRPIQQLTGRRSLTIPIIVDLNRFKPPDDRNESSVIKLLFTGVMETVPNKDAVNFFLKDIMPRLADDNFQVELHLVGRGAGSLALVDRDGSGDRVKCFDDVDDVAEFYRRCDIYICPLRTGTGIKVKILEAMASGCAIVTTSIGAEGLPVSDGVELMIVDDARNFASAIISLSRDDELRRAIGGRARAFIEDYIGHLAVQQARLKELIE